MYVEHQFYENQGYILETDFTKNKAILETNFTRVNILINAIHYIYTTSGVFKLIEATSLRFPIFIFLVY